MIFGTPGGKLKRAGTASLRSRKLFPGIRFKKLWKKGRALEVGLFAHDDGKSIQEIRRKV
jgi:hypothetical protein